MRRSLVVCGILMAAHGVAFPSAFGQPAENVAASPTTPDQEKGIAGTWEGALDVGGIKLRLVLHLRREGQKYLATLDSPDQGARGIPMDSVTFQKHKLTVEAKKLKAKFEGEVDADHSEIEGHWIQGGRELPLTLSRVASATKRKRPQTPAPPFPYRSEEVSFDHIEADFRLAGTLTVPNGSGPFAAAVLITGSGPQDRDETIFEHKPFLVLADHLTRAGMAVLRVDDRGVGGTGVDDDPADDTSADFATDVTSSLAYLRTRSEVDERRIGLIGHSEGALIGAMVAAEDNGIAFLVLWAGTGVPGDEILAVQAAKLAKAGGASDVDIASNRALQEEVFRIIRSESDPAKGRDRANAFLLEQYENLSQAAKQASGTAEQFARQQSAIVANAWFRHFIKHDPRRDLKRVRCPVLAITGEKDLQAAPEQNLPEIEAALKAGGNRDVTIRTMEGLNHLFQTAQTGSVAEYVEIEETISPNALEAISGWLSARGLLR